MCARRKHNKYLFLIIIFTAFFSRARRTIRAGLTFALLAASAQAHAQSGAAYPVKSVRIVLPFGTGGTNLMARWLAPKLSEAMGQTFVVDPRLGAGGNIGNEIVAKSAPDGYTLLIAPPGLVFSPFLYKRAGYDPLRDFTPIALLGSVPNVMAVHPSVPARHLREVIEIARKQPKKLAYGSGGVGSTNHLAMESLKSLAKIDIVHVPYKGRVDGAGGCDQRSDRRHGGRGAQRCALHPARQAAWHRHAQRKALKSALPELMTTTEAGQPDFVMTNWYGFFGPAGLPREIVARLNAEAVKAIKLPDTRERLGSQGFDLFPSSAQELGHTNGHRIRPLRQNHQSGRHPAGMIISI